MPSLEAMVGAGYRPSLVVTQPPRPAGRGRRLQEPAAAEAAHRLGLRVLQPERVRDPRLIERIRRERPEVAVVVAFGQIFPVELLELPRLGCVNVHASLLPAYRGAAPIQAAIADGRRRTGVTTMRMEEGLDTGPILLQEEVEIGPQETAGELGERLSVVGADLLVRTLARLEAGALEARPQSESGASYAPRLRRSDALVDWRLSARTIFDRLRAQTPWPGAVTELRGRPLKVLWGRPREGVAGDPPGTLLGLVDGRLEIVCGGDTLFGLERAQRPGKKAITASDLVHGEHLTRGEHLPSPSAPRDG